MVHVIDNERQYDQSGKRDKSYCFDNVFSDQTGNTQIFNSTLAPLIPTVLEGYNVTCFAYGMTGAGKTHTMLGNSSLDSQNPQNPYTDRGICLQSVQEMFLGILERQIDFEYDLKVSYLEIYNEQVRDLLVFTQPGAQISDKSPNLMIVEDPVKGVIVPDLTEYRIGNGQRSNAHQAVEEVESLIIMGNQKRTMAPTGANQFSSRSHAILIINVEGRNRKRSVKEEVFYSKLQLIDLAGSERACVSDNRGMRMVEGANINKSLLALGNCINILSDKGKIGSFVPYRDSKLTRLLKDSLGGNTKTIMIACISPSFQAYEETVNTLKYASRARNIKKVTTRNVKEVEMHVSKYKDIIENLRGEIEFLRVQLKQQQQIGPDSESISVSPSNINFQDNSESKAHRDISQKRSSTQKLGQSQPAQKKILQSRKSNYLNNSSNGKRNTQGNNTPLRLSNQNVITQIATHRNFQHQCSSPLDVSQSLSFIQPSSDQKLPSSIDKEIQKIKNEKQKLEKELMFSEEKVFKDETEEINLSEQKQEDIEEELYIEKLSQNLLSNFEEHWELKQSISEIEELQGKNQEQLHLLTSDVVDLEKQQQNILKNASQSSNRGIEQQLQKVLQFKQNELRILEKNSQNNIKILHDMKITLQTNQDQKAKLQGMLLKMHSSKKKYLIENQIELRKLKLEKTDLYLQNLQMIKITQQQQFEKDQNEQKMNEMQKILEAMQQKLMEKDDIIKESQKQIQKKEQELQKIKQGGIVQQPVHQKTLSFNGTQSNSEVKSSLQHTMINNHRRESAQINSQQTNNLQSQSARAQWNVQPQQVKVNNEISKKLLLSGFFEDDFQGEVVDSKKSSPLKNNSQVNDQGIAPSTLNIVNSVLQNKRQSQDIRQNQKGYTPNNRYKQNAKDSPSPMKENSKAKQTKQQASKKDLSISQITINNDTNQSEVIQYNDLFQQEDKQSLLLRPDSNISQNKKISLPTSNQVFVAQINLFKDEKGDYQVISQAQQQEQQIVQQQAKNNTRYEDQKQKQEIKEEKLEQQLKQQTYDSRRQTQDSSRKTRSSKLNRYLSFNRKGEDDKEKETHILNSMANQQNNIDQHDPDRGESEKENYSSRNNLKNTTQQQRQVMTNKINLEREVAPSSNSAQLDMFRTFNKDDSHQLNQMMLLTDQENNIIHNNKRQTQAFSPKSKFNEVNDLRKEIVSKFEQRKYSQQTNLKQQNPTNKKPPSPGRQSQQSENSMTSSQTNVFQSYAQIRKQSKERLQLQQSLTKQKTLCTSQKECAAAAQGIQFKIDNQNIQSKNKATANISRYGPIKPQHSSNNAQFQNQQMTSQLKQSFSGQETPTSSNNGSSYFENFIKKKNSMINFNSQQQPSNQLNHQPKLSSGAIKVPQPQVNCQLSQSQNGNVQQHATLESLEEMHLQFQTLNQQQRVGNNQVQNKELDSLLNKQKEQLNKEKEKLQKNQTIFTTSFAQTLANINSQPAPQTERYHQFKEDMKNPKFDMRQTQQNVLKGSEAIINAAQHNNKQQNRYNKKTSDDLDDNVEDDDECIAYDDEEKGTDFSPNLHNRNMQGSQPMGGLVIPTSQMGMMRSLK